MKNIKWQNAETDKPPIDIHDEFNFANKYSVRALVRVIDRRGDLQAYSFGVYYKKSDHWNIEGYRGDFKVTHFAEINEPL